MRHRKVGRKFHRKTGQRRAFMRSLVCALIKSESIETTEARAKSLRPDFEKALTMARRGDVASRRLLLQKIHDKPLVHKLVDDIAPRYKGRTGGYTRITKLAKVRKRDGSRLVEISLV